MIYALIVQQAERQFVSRIALFVTLLDGGLWQSQASDVPS